MDTVRPVDIAMKSAYYEVLEAAHQCVNEGSIDKIHTRRDEYGYRSIMAHSDQGWSTWYNEADDEPEGKSE